MLKRYLHIILPAIKKKATLPGLVIAITLIVIAGYRFPKQDHWLINNRVNYTAITTAIFLLILIYYFLKKENRRANKAGWEQRIQKEHLKVILNSISEGLITTNRAGEIVFMNSSAEKLTQWNANEAQGLPLQQIYHVVNEETGIEPENIAKRIVEQKKAIDVVNNAILYAKNAKPIAISTSATPLMDKKGNVSGTVLVFNDISKRKEEEKRVAQQIINAQDEERQYIGSELHDNVNQVLAASQINLDLAMLKLQEKERALLLMEKSRGLIEQAVHEIRKLSHELAPDMFEMTSLKQMIEQLFAGINSNNRFEVSLYFEELEDVILNSDIQKNLYRIVQEQIKNILKHSGATEIKITFKQKDNLIKMRIYDNGKGFNMEEPRKGGIGLKSIKRRVELFNGKFKVNSAVGEGCEIIIQIPLPVAA